MDHIEIMWILFYQESGRINCTQFKNCRNCYICEKIKIQKWNRPDRNRFVKKIGRYYAWGRALFTWNTCNTVKDWWHWLEIVAIAFAQVNFAYNKCNWLKQEVQLASPMSRKSNNAHPQERRPSKGPSARECVFFEPSGRGGTRSGGGYSSRTHNV